MDTRAQAVCQRTDGNNQHGAALNEALTSELIAVPQTDNPTWQTLKQHYLFGIYDGQDKILFTVS